MGRSLLTCGLRPLKRLKPLWLPNPLNLYNDGVNGLELWVSDGTTEGTQLVKDINPTDRTYRYPNIPIIDNLTEFNGQLFFVANDEITGNELWVSDGTTAGTKLLKDINPEITSYEGSEPSKFTEFNGQLFFVANDGTTGNELWVTDGTTDGTRLFKDINPNSNGDRPGFGPNGFGVDSFTVVGNLIFFSADDGFSGSELWVSDGTAEGTMLYQDINPGFNGSSPGGFKVVGDQLFFTANDGTNGDELWVLDIPDNTISGDDGDNVLNGTDGVDLIDGAGGNDVIFGRGDDDSINGGDDDDVLFGNRGDDLIDGGAGNDRVFGNQGDDTLKDAAGDDTLLGGAGNDTVVVSDFEGTDFYDGGGGQDTLLFNPSDDRDLTLSLESGTVEVGHDGFLFFTNFEQIIAGNGDDQVIGDRKANVLDGGNGDDSLEGGAGKDTLLGGNGDDELRGNAGRDSLLGGLGADVLLGGRGADVLEGGQGSDVMFGERGPDTFVFKDDLLDGVADIDIIQGFQAQDTLDFTDYLGAGGSIEVTRVTAEFLRIDLSAEDVVNVFGSSEALDEAQTQLSTVV